ELRRGALGGRLEAPRPEERQPRRLLPADLHVDAVAEGRPSADEAAVALGDVDEVPVEPGVEPRGQPGRHVGGEHGGREEHVVEGLGANEPGEHVHPRLRQRRLQARIIRDEDASGAGGLRGRALDRGAADDARDLAAELRRLREHAERALRQLVAVVLEEDERLHSSRRSCRNATICSGALPSSSIRRESPRGGGGFSPSTTVAELSSPASERPRSPSESTSCGFFFAPMIPFSDGYRGSLIASETATTAGSGASIRS